MLNKKVKVPNKKINIAIDGLSSTGKSTLAKELAKDLGYIYIDSGAMYRAITLFLLDNAIAIQNKNEVLEKALNSISIQFINQRMFLNDEDVEDKIRSLRIAGSVSEVAAIPAVRDFCVAQQQAYGKDKGVVMDGRDIGTVVFPEAELKIFLFASQKVRVQRRYDEMMAKGKETTLEEVEKNLLHRDQIDSTREYNPLRKADDARELDNSDLSVRDQIGQIKNWIAWES
jgi:cytidylate kinase